MIIKLLRMNVCHFLCQVGQQLDTPGGEGWHLLHMEGTCTHLSAVVFKFLLLQRGTSMHFKGHISLLPSNKSCLDHCYHICLPVDISNMLLVLQLGF